MKFDLFDMHCHLGFCNNAVRAACELAAEGVGAFSNTVTPAEFVAQRAAFAGAGNMRVGVGLHPWWVGERGAFGSGASVAGEQATLGADVLVCDGYALSGAGASASGELTRQGAAASSHDAADNLELLCELVARSRFVGEVGLDFSPRWAATREAQLQVFEAVAATCARTGGKVLSIHAVRAADQVLDVLERTGALAPTAGNACVIHWFSGTSDQLTRARRAGCCFSVNPRMLQSKRGRAYAQAIPANRLLLETDEPVNQGAPWDAAHVRHLLEETLQQLATLRGEDLAALRERIAETSRCLLA